MKKIALSTLIFIITQLSISQTITTFSSGYSSIEGIAINSDNEVYVSEHYSGKIYSVDKNGTKTFFTNTGGGYAGDITFNDSDQLFIIEPFMADILKSDRDGNISTYKNFIGISINGLTMKDGLLYYSDNPVVNVIEADLSIKTHSSGYLFAEDIAFDSKGTLYVADRSNRKLYKVTSDGTKTVVADYISNIRGVAVAPNDVVYFTMDNHYPVENKVMKYDPETNIVSDFVTTGLDDPRYLAIDKLGNMYVTNSGSESIVKIYDESLLPVTGVMSLYENIGVLDFLIYPIPSEKVLNIDLNTEIYKIEVYNNLGQLVLNNISVNTIDISLLNPGLYFVKVEDVNGNSGLKKIIKE